MDIISKRIRNIKESGIRKIFNLSTMAGDEVVNLSIGQPHFKAPDSLKDAAKKAIDENLNSYTPTLGNPILRERIVKKLKEKNNIDAKLEEVIVTSGVSGAIFLGLSATIDQGDEVILPDPYFIIYKEVLTFLGAKIVYLDTYPDFHINPKKLESLITGKTKMIICNSPSNPTGAVYDRAEMEKIAGIARKNNLLIMSDEIYERFDYDNKFVSMRNIYKNTITVNGFSKDYAITGWRVGYAHASKELVEEMNKLQQYTFVCAPSAMQEAIAKEFDVDLSKEYKSYKKKRDFVYESLKDRYELNMPEGAFYAFVKIPERRDGFIEELAKNKLLVVPGSAFSNKDTHFRISFAASDEDLKKGMKILKKIY